MNLEDNRIKIINHSINKGVYFSRVEAILNAKAKYIILMDPDDMLLNENLFKKLYDYNLKYNIDIIEFRVYHQIEGKRSLISPNNHFESHYHNFSKNIIYQPELSEILYQIPNHKIYSKTICRNIWNKMIRRAIFLI
jgi:glycosyltransferase involved in cell wall biosynthesis